MSTLLLTRKVKEGIVVHIEALDEIICEITVTKVGSKNVKLAFKARDEINIDRKEIYLKNKEK
tara:strand:+ start:486 stop:674 length:189 start_codon:yes stop_codon:yes gene_type:complete